MPVIFVRQQVDQPVGPLHDVADALVDRAVQQDFFVHDPVTVEFQPRELLALEPADERTAAPVRESCAELLAVPI